jgi:hypothetical protein
MFFGVKLKTPRHMIGCFLLPAIADHGIYVLFETFSAKILILWPIYL